MDYPLLRLVVKDLGTGVKVRKFDLSVDAHLGGVYLQYLKGDGEICVCVFFIIYFIKLMKGKALRKHSLHEKTAASVLLKLFISSNE